MVQVSIAVDWDKIRLRIISEKHLEQFHLWSWNHMGSTNSFNERDYKKIVIPLFQNIYEYLDNPNVNTYVDLISKNDNLLNLSYSEEPYLTFMKHLSCSLTDCTLENQKERNKVLELVKKYTYNYDK